MEPVKGGVLANPIRPVKDILDKAKSEASYASWAIRYAASLNNVITVLSGMSTLEQMQDNLSYMRHFMPLSEEERQIIYSAQVALNEDKSIACTACRYCIDGCPMGIPIPDMIAIKNKHALDRDTQRAKKAYEITVDGKGKASECLYCGGCERACPQHLPIPKIMRECAIELE